MGAGTGTQILDHLCKSVPATLYDTKWVPSSARFVALGAYARGTGCLQVFELQEAELEVALEAEKPAAIKCGTFGATGSTRHLATGDFEGRLQTWDLERCGVPVFEVAAAHAGIINHIDGIGGEAPSHGPPELATCGRDGCVRVWDTRQPARPAAAFEPLPCDACVSTPPFANDDITNAFEPSPCSSPTSNSAEPETHAHSKGNSSSAAGEDIRHTRSSSSSPSGKDENGSSVLRNSCSIPSSSVGSGVGGGNIGSGRSTSAPPDCWCVGFGNAFSDEERCLVAGYANGDVKLFDLRTNRLRWHTNVGAGVCGAQFDRRDIPMNKFLVTCLRSRFYAFDARTQHLSKGFAKATQTIEPATSPEGATLWATAHAPQNRDVAMVTAGDGSLNLYKYCYPDKRWRKAADGQVQGVAGSLQLLARRELSSQPVTGFDWAPDFAGLFCSAAFDQCVRVGLVTNLHKL